MAHFIHTADVMAALANEPDNSFDGCVTDPPYGLNEEPDVEAMLYAWLKREPYHPGGTGFMGKAWDACVPGPEVWRELLRVLKPGASAFVFAGDRTEDLMCMALRLGGFRKRGTVPWLYGSGFPKSLNIGKAIDAKLGGARPVVGQKEHTPKFAGANNGGFNDRVGEGKNPTFPLTAPATLEAAIWDSHGTALKPAYEPAIWVMKPYDGTYAHNALTWGVAGLNIDGSRLDFGSLDDERVAKNKNRHASFGSGPRVGQIYGDFNKDRDNWSPSGRWPANVVIGDDIAAELGELRNYFYCAKPTREERDAGLEGFTVRTGGELTGRGDGTAGVKHARAGAGHSGGGRNTHPTVKPIALTRYLASLLLPPPRAAGPRRLIVPFSGSGSELIGGLLAGWEDIVGIDLEPEYVAIALARLAYWASLDTPKSKTNGQMGLFDHGLLGQEGA
jgi:DNA modification methylase